MAAGGRSTGISPRPILMGAPRNALRAFNAGVSLSGRKVIAHAPPRAFHGMLLFRSAHRASWRTCRMAHFQPVLYPSAI